MNSSLTILWLQYYSWEGVIIMAKKTNKPKVAAKAGATAKAKPEGGYKDPYSGKVYESKEAFVAMKTKEGKNTNFALLYGHLFDVVKKGTKEANVDVQKVGLKTMDSRLPRYVLGFIKGGQDYKVSLDQKAWNKRSQSIFMPTTHPL